MVHKLLSPSFWLDKFIFLSLKFILFTLQSILHLIKREDAIHSREVISVAEKQATEKILKEKQKQMERVLSKNSESVTHTTEPKTVNIITGTPSELEPDETVNEINVPNESIKEINKDKPQERDVKNHNLEIVCPPPFEMKTAHNNSVNSDSNMIPIEFHWRHGGHKVFVTGDFDNWQATKHEMHRKPGTNDFAAVVSIDRTKQHEFKFVVDGGWHCNGDLPTRYDERGNVNNIIYAFPAGPLSPEFKEHIVAPFNSHMTAAY